MFHLAGKGHHGFVTEFEPGSSVKFLPTLPLLLRYKNNADLDVGNVMSMVGIRTNMHQDSSEAIDDRLLTGLQVFGHVQLFRKLDV